MVLCRGKCTVAALLLVSVSFVAITMAYISIFYSLVWTGATARDEDVRVAKKMALLIGTDFLCWAPTIFFGTLITSLSIEICH